MGQLLCHEKSVQDPRMDASKMSEVLKILTGTEGTFSCLLGLKQYYVDGKVSCSSTQHIASS